MQILGENEKEKVKTVIIQNVQTLNLYVINSADREVIEAIKEALKDIRHLLSEKECKTEKISHPSHSEREHKHENGEKTHRGAPSIQTLDELLSFTKGDRKYARNIVRKRKLIGVEYNGTVYAIDPELVDQLKSGATTPEELSEEYREVAKAIAEGKVKLIKNVQLQNMI